MSALQMRSRYLADKVNTATPAQLVVMLYDRLEIDIERAIVAQDAAEPAMAAASLLHAQQVVTELLATLDVSAWTGAQNLANLYGYLLGELIAVRDPADPSRLRAVAKIVADLGSAWRDAAEQLAGGEASNRLATAGAWVG